MWPIQIFRLVSEPTDPGLFCGKDGLTLGGIPLLAGTEGDFEPYPATRLQEVFDAAYGSGTGVDAESRMLCLASVARALATGDIFKATIISLMLRLPEIDPVGMERLSRLNQVAKFNPRVDTETRNWHGEWSTSGGGGPDANHNIVPVQASAMPLPGPAPVLGGSAGKPKKDDDWSFPAVIPPAKTGPASNDNAGTNTQSAANDNQPEACPPARFEPSSVGRTDDQLRYQAQVTGLPLGYAVELDGVWFDGCRESSGTLLEAKNSTGWFIFLPEDEIRSLNEYKETVGQVEYQILHSGQRKIEWHFSDPFLSFYWRKEFRRLGFSPKVTVEYTAYNPAYNYNIDKKSLAAWVR